jgi:hypothetical protein
LGRSGRGALTSEGSPEASGRSGLGANYGSQVASAHGLGAKGVPRAWVECGVA